MAFNALTPMCFFMALFFIVSVKSQNILSDSAGLEGEVLTLICDLSRAGAVPPSNFYGVRSLTVSKLNPETNEFDPQVIYAPPGGPITSFLQNQMDNKYYNVEAQGLDPNNPSDYAGNENIMQITVTFTSLRCVDRGTYQCSAEYTVQSGLLYPTETSEQTQDLTIDVQPSLISGTSNPFQSLGYENNENVTFRCRFQGPPSMEVRWFFKQCQDDSFFDPIIQRWTIENDIQTNTNPLDSQDCGTVEMDSTLKVQLNRIGSNNDPSVLLCWVQCQAGIIDNLVFTEFEQWNMSITYKDNQDDGQTGESTEPDDTNVVAIVGPIVGVLVLIVVVALLVYFCWYRKRAKEEKYQEEDKPNTEYTLPSAPPVFYSKPEKEKNKDNTTDGKSKKTYDDYDERRGSSYKKDVEGYAHRDSGYRKDNDDYDRYGKKKDMNDHRPRSSSYDQRGKSYRRDTDEESDNAYASTDVSRSEDEYYTRETGRERTKPQPKRRSHVPGRDGRRETQERNEEKDEEKPLHYAELDLPQRGRDDPGSRRPRREDPVAYASIQV